MKTSGLFTLHGYKVDTVLGHPLKLIIFGDVHRDSDLFADDHWRRFLSYAKAHPTAIFLGMGDWLDGVSTSERNVLNDDRLHDTTRTTLEEHYRARTRDLASELGFMKGRLIGMLGGNHYFQFRDGTTCDNYLCQILGCRFLGVMSMVHLALRAHNNVKAIDIAAHHGLGGGKRTSSQFIAPEDMATKFEADILVQGHSHGRGVTPLGSRLRIKNANGVLALEEREIWAARSGSFLKSYENGRVGYNVDACRGPASLGWIEFELTMDRINRTHKSHNGELVIRIRGIA